MLLDFALPVDHSMLSFCCSGAQTYCVSCERNHAMHLGTHICLYACCGSESPEHCCASPWNSCLCLDEEAISAPNGCGSMRQAGWGALRDDAAVALQNDFTPEEEEEVRRESQWAFD